ncbi:histidinol dehydrogenase [Sulfuracidifex tepidarius]|uniref:Histidinol dehydrogenase n=1 Tax=Sulfuracidifex tepidarius TaxID=1294262 RepID=A0A510DV06_9CREN|nr:histidinol dehydrogenase [Sulfuracidifex tepidarius]BBG24017.1 Histidinol dehydrogenase [Sulfuracidifex tepidarius]BBG26772.1 Histidinol dehydrogenase [Sulfuracidifex tepidarius]
MIHDKLPEVRPNSLEPFLDKVKEIINDVVRDGDQGLIDLTAKFDNVRLSSVKASDEEIKESSESLPEEVKSSIDMIWDQLKNFHESAKPPNFGGGRNGISFGIMWKPIDRVGIYVPGGLKSYPSTLMMAGIPAKVAGVKEVHVSTPTKGKLDPAIAYVGRKLGVKAFYKIGGAQAIAAMAYGTSSVAKVDKIVGPGNVFVQAAKFLVSNMVGIDGIEGPTELVVLADDSADPSLIAKDLVAQGEHGPLSFLVLISWSEALLNKVREALISLGQDKSKENFYLVLVRSPNEGIDQVNQIGPEHLSLYVSKPREILSSVRNVGAVSLGRTPPAIIDYAAGPNHILPTNGWAKFRGGVTVYDFLKPVMYAEADSPSTELIKASITLANYEGFRVHGESIGDRYE